MGGFSGVFRIACSCLRVGAGGMAVEILVFEKYVYVVFVRGGEGWKTRW